MSKLPLAALAALAATLGAPAQAASRLDDSGAALCRNTLGLFTALCGGTGQDGAAGRDLQFPAAADGAAGFRFVKICHAGDRAGQGGCPADPPLGPGDADWGCTMDRTTGLVWEVKTHDGGLRDASRRYTFPKKGHAGWGQPGDVALWRDAVNAEGLCGHADWRLPDVRELQSIVHYGATLPAIDTAFFPHTDFDALTGYWTGTPSQAVTGNSAWALGFDRGNVVDDVRDVAVQHHARLVRGARAKPRFTLAAGGAEVRDASTGLTWRRCVEGQAWSGLACIGQPATLRWSEALQRGGDGGWRLPNVKELSSLVDRQARAPAIAPLFPRLPAYRYWLWTSTPAWGTVDEAWSVDFELGAAGRSKTGGSLELLGNVRLVRDTVQP